MKKLSLYLTTVSVIFCIFSYAQTTTSWKGTINTSWGTSTNWTNGLPSSTNAAIIGDASFTGSFQPTISSGYTLKNITIGGTVASVLTISKAVTINEDITINSNGTLSQGNISVTVKGNWNNSGTYNLTSNTKCVVNFGGSIQSIGGSSVTTFHKCTINSGTIVTLTNNMVVNNLFTIKGTMDPSTFTASGAAGLTIDNGGLMRVNTTLFTDNYNFSGTKNAIAGSTVDYLKAGDQTISSLFAYSTLKISGSGIKSLIANLSDLKNSGATFGNIQVTAGTFDMAGFTANRSAGGTTGGTLTLANTTTLKLSGTNNFPANYNSYSLAPNSTVEYYGNTTPQTVSSKTYGNLTFTGGTTGTLVKTMPTGALTIVGNLISTVGTATSLSFTAGNSIMVTGSVNIGSGTTFNASTFSHTLQGTLTNTGTLTGATSTISITGADAIISGTGVYSFNNLTIAASGISAAATTTITVAGNLITSGSGAFTHAAGGTLTMSGTTKNITGTGFNFANLTASGTITANNSIEVTGNLTSSNSFTAAGVVTLSGATKTISGAGTVSFASLTVTGSVTSSINVGISASLNVSGSLSATAGTFTFSATSTLNGTANLFTVIVSGTTFKLNTNAVLGIANTFTISAGSFDVSSTTPNTVYYNGASSQNITATTYDNLTLATGGTKSLLGTTAVNNIVTIEANGILDGTTNTLTVKGNWVNNGTFTPSTSTVAFTGTANTFVIGATTFNAVTVNKSISAATLTLSNDVSTATIALTTGVVQTGSNTLTITNTRTGTGQIFGKIKRQHTFSTATTYEFGGSNNSINFSAVSSVTSITMQNLSHSVTDFPFGGAVNREYNITIPSGTYTATLRLQYDDAELNGNTEATLDLWRYNGSSWVLQGNTARSSTNNYVEYSALTSIANRWAFTSAANVADWNGSVSSDVANASNWTATQGSPTLPPTSNDIVQIGVSTFTNNPTVSGSFTVKGMVMGSAKAVNLTIASGGTLTTTGNISGSWSTNRTDTINVGSGTLNVNGNMVLSDGTTDHSINLLIGTGTATVLNSITQTGNANIVFSGAGNLNIGVDYSYTSGTVTASTGTITYNGSNAQNVAGGISYNNLVINKSAGIASLNTATTINGNVTVITGTFNINAASTIEGNVTISSGATLNGDGITTTVKGNWANSGTFISASGTIKFMGATNQTISATPFNNVEIEKTAGTASLTGNITTNGNLTLTNGTLDLATFTANRSVLGGILTAANGTTILVGGSNNFPSNYSTNTFGTTSLVHYNGVVAQTVSGITYGDLTFSNGTTNAKTFSANLMVNNNLTINSGATLNGSSYTLNLVGNWVNSGTFTPATSTTVFQGTTKTITGTTTFNNATFSGSYSAGTSDVSFNGLLLITSTGSYAAGSGNATVSGDLTNSGSLTSTGTTTFSGTAAQTIRLLNAITSTSTGVINFNGSISPTLNSNSTPFFATLNINNTGGVSPSVGWTVLVAFNVNTGGIFNGGTAQHNISCNFTNSGTVTSQGILNFNPSSAKTINFGSTGFSSAGTVNFAGAGAITLSGTPTSFTDIKISNTNAAGITPSSAWTVNGSLNVFNGSILNASTFTHTIAANMDCDGTLNGQTSTFSFTGTTALVGGNPLATFNNFTVATGATVTLVNDINVSGNFTNNATFDASAASLSFTGTGSSLIDGTTSPQVIAQITNSKTGNGSTTLNKNLSGLVDLTIESGIFNAAALTLGLDAAGASLTIGETGILKIAGTNTVPSFTTYTINALGTVDYSGANTTQTISTAFTYGSITISGAGTKKPLASITALGNFTLTAGVFDGNALTHNIAGNFAFSGGTFTNTGTTINLNGTGTQDLSSTAAFNNLTINKVSGSATMSSNITVSNVLTLASGVLVLNANTLSLAGTLTSTGSSTITGSSSSNLDISGAGALGTLNFTSGARLLNNLTINRTASGTVTMGTDVAIGGVLTQTAGTLIIGSNTLSLNGTATGSGTLRGSLTSNISVGGTGALGTINFDQTTDGTTNALSNLTINRTSSGTLSIGNKMVLINVLTPTAGVLTTAGFLHLRSNATNTARIAPGSSSGGYISGEVTVERHLTALTNRAYRLLAPTVTTTTNIRDNWQEGVNNTVVNTNVNSPLAGYGTHITGVGGSTNGFDVTQNNGSSLFIYTTAPTDAWTAVTNTNVNTLNANTGYLLFVRGNRDNINTINSTTGNSNTILRAKGTLTMGNQTLSNLSSNGNVSLIANPYASPISWNDIYTGTNATNFENYITIFDPNVGSRGGYITVTNNNTTGGGATNLTIDIQSGQAFFIQTKAGINNPSFSIAETNKSTTNNLDVYRAGLQTETLKTFLYYTDNSGIVRCADGVTSIFSNSYSNAIDANDAQQINNWDEDVAINRANKLLSIESRNLADANDTIPLAITRLKTQAYQWKIIPQNFNAPGIQAQLRDNFTNTNTNISLSDTTVISFTTTADVASKASNRFSIVFKSNAALPVTISNVKAYTKNSGVQVEWQISNEINIESYEVEKSSNAINFTTLNNQQATGSNQYQSFDANPTTGNNFYRIKAIEKSGKTSYTQIVKVTIGQTKSAISIYPNPVTNNQVGLQLNQIAKGNYQVRIINKIGQTLFTKTIAHAGGTASHKIQVNNTNLSSGVYQLLVEGEGVQFTQTLLKQ